MPLEVLKGASSSIASKECGSESRSSECLFEPSGTHLLLQQESSKVPLVLVVEDHPGLRDLIGTVLNDAGYGVMTAPNGEEAIRAASERVVDLLLTDRRMPGMDGTSLARIFQTQHKNAGIVVMSGSDLETLKTQTTGVHFLRKPFTSKSLLAIVAQSLAESLQGQRRALDATPPVP